MGHFEKKHWKIQHPGPAGVLPVLVTLLYFLESSVGNSQSRSEYETLLPTGEIMEAFFWPTGTEIRTKLDQANFQEERIIGGRDAIPSEAPYQVGIFQKGKGIHCGGTLINRNTVVTAAHCFSSSADNDIEDFVFAFGKVDLRIPEPTDFLTTAAESIRIHPKYDWKLVVNDIAIVKLKDPVCFNSNTQPLSLPTETTSGWKPIGNLKISGWGYTRKRPRDELANKGEYYPTHLKVTEIEYIPEDVCVAQVRVIKGNRSDITIKHPSTFCAGVANGSQDNCQGDSGGPVVCKDVNGKPYLCGVVSGGFGCGLRETPGIYVNVPAVMDWVKEYSNDDCSNSSPTN